jgi:hypothetical protein
MNTPARAFGPAGASWKRPVCRPWATQRSLRSPPTEGPGAPPLPPGPARPRPLLLGRGGLAGGRANPRNFAPAGCPAEARCDDERAPNQPADLRRLRLVRPAGEAMHLPQARRPARRPAEVSPLVLGPAPAGTPAARPAQVVPGPPLAPVALVPSYHTGGPADTNCGRHNRAASFDRSCPGHRGASWRKGAAAVNRTDEQAIVDLMGMVNDIRFRANVIRVHASDQRVQREVAGILRQARRARSRLSRWWQVARRRSRR